LPTSDPLEAFDGWELEGKLDHVGRILGMAAVREACGSGPAADQPHGWSAPATAPPASALDWALTKTAVSAITCGAILAAWWWIAARQDLIQPALASLVIGHLAWFGQWCCDANRRVPSFNR
jgi:hypothetical protein